MAMPTATSPRNNPSHAMLHKFHVNVKAFGATGDGATDDRAAIQAAYDSLGSAGTLYFPAGTYKITGAINAGSATSFTHSIVGQKNHADVPLSKITQTTLGADIFDVTMTSSQANSFHIDGLFLYYPSTATGTAIKIIPDNWTAFVHIEDVRIQNAGVGVELKSLVGPVVRNTLFRANTIGAILDGTGANLPTFENCWFQFGEIGIDVRCLAGRLRATSCVFESMSVAGVRTASVAQGGPGAIWVCHFDSCWWEGGGVDGIQINGVNSGSAGHAWQFTGCNMWLSGATYNFINNKLGLSSGGCIQGVAFDSCEFVSNGGDILDVAQVPSAGSGDAGYSSVSFTNCHGAGALKGIHPSTGFGGGAAIFTGSAGPRYSNIDFMGGDAVQGVEFPAAAGAGALNIYRAPIALQGPGQFVEFLENGTADAAAGAANTGRLYVKDNGAGKTQLVIRFPTGAVQVLATEP